MNDERKEQRSHRATCRAAGHHARAHLVRCLRADLLRIAQETIDPGIERLSAKRSLSLLLTPPGLAVAVHRLAHTSWARGWTRLANAIAWTNHLVHKVSITPASCLGEGLFLPHPAGVTFHGRAGRGVGLYTDCLCGASPLSPAAPIEEAPILEDDVLVGIHVAVLGRVRVGQGTNLPVKLTIREDVPARAVVASKSLQHRVVCSVDGAPDGRG